MSIPVVNVKFSDINKELYAASNAQRSINDGQGRLLASVGGTTQNLNTSTLIPLGNFRGHAYSRVYITSGEKNVDMLAKSTSTGRYLHNFTLSNVYIQNQTIIGSTSVDSPSLTIANFGNYDKQFLMIETGSYVAGKGGHGGSVGFVGYSAEHGGAGLAASSFVTIYNYGTIGGGGGGGGFGGNAYNGYLGTLYIGGGGGGGAGNEVGSGGFGGGASGGGPGSPGQSVTAGGPGGPGAWSAGNGGPGGNLGIAGTPGNPGVGVPGTWAIATGGGNGEPAGFSITGYENVLLRYGGDIRGPTTTGGGSGGNGTYKFYLMNQYIADAASQVSTPPASYLRWNTPAQSSASVIYVNQACKTAGQSITTPLNNAKNAGISFAGGVMTIGGVDANNQLTTQCVNYDIIGEPVYIGDVWQFPVQFKSVYGNPFATGATVVFAVTV